MCAKLVACKKKEWLKKRLLKIERALLAGIDENRLVTSNKTRKKPEGLLRVIIKMQEIITKSLSSSL